MAYTEIQNSSYLQFTGYSLVDLSATVQHAYRFGDSDYETADSSDLINVAIILPRANDPTALLEADWGTRQQMLAELGSDGVWDTYGADSTTYSDVVSYFGGDNSEDQIYPTFPYDAYSNTYVSSAESRTLWVQMDGTTFSQFFGTTLYYCTSQEFYFWEGNLNLPDDFGWELGGLWFDASNSPEGENQAHDASVALPQGVQSIGNTLTATNTATSLNPQDIAADFYNFPLNGEAVPTGAIGLVEPGIGTAIPGPDSFDHYTKEYRKSVGVSGDGLVYTQGAVGQSYPDNGGLERSLDVGVVTAINPNSDIAMYVGSGDQYGATSSVFTAYQSAIWQDPDTVPVGWTNPAVISSSWGDGNNPDPSSLFYSAYSELFVDAALNNQTIFTALGDGGSGNQQSNGLTNVTYNYASPYSVLVGGTSVSTVSQATQDYTLTPFLQLAAGGDRATLWRLVAGGLTSSPKDANATQQFIEVVWNQYYLDGTTLTADGYTSNNTTSGGVDTTQPTPSYQLDFGLTPTTTTNPYPGQGRGLPDVAANAGGNTYYVVPSPDMKDIYYDWGTSAATPLWASLAIQFNAIFADQGLPQLGYMTDLLYLAAAVAPGAFNDITMGNNMSSYRLGGTYDSQGEMITPTGYGYEATPGYDLTTGLGSPNGLLLARTLTAIAHSQMSYPLSPDVIVQLPVDPSDPASAVELVSGTRQSLMFQPILAADDAWSLSLGGSDISFSGTASGSYAWTSQLAQQSLQQDFSADLVTLFDRFSQGTVYQTVVEAGAGIGVDIQGAATSLPQINLTSAFGFVDFTDADGDSAIQVARAVAIAETALATDDQTAIMRMRQNGMNDVSVLFYEVDDFAGTVDGLAPGDAGYDAAATARAYQESGGATWIAGKGYGQYGEAELIDVDSGDLIAMILSNGTDTFYAFAQANEQVDGQSVAHLWSYGLNTWGWEDLYGGGDRDYNDLVVQLDFTSAYGSGWIA
ncbi:DUF4114 domain-containing protein [Aquabacter spiritensis]|uniref:Uncharacterized protein DUF4114 n=1 Tax=Aquabacter spiritensis TaxID=933073 RepID=A0A4R3LR72_9HYPH|nr:DUF4114 domain-containing protein [Aquabacter spiritensis]TCT02982.1 uncharacterized protein DUF4114 [Aquabacter spiritensis]